MFKVRLLLFAQFFSGNSHTVERTVNENQGNDKEDCSQTILQVGIGHGHGNFRCQQSEQGREFDDRVQRHGRCIFEGIADGVADNAGFMQRSVFHLQIDFNNLLAVIPATAGIGHEDRLIQTEESDTDQITDEEVGVKEGQRQTHEEDHDEDIDHTLLSILGTNLNNFLGIFNRCFFFIQIDILLNKHNGLI